MVVVTVAYSNCDRSIIIHCVSMIWKLFIDNFFLLWKFCIFYTFFGKRQKTTKRDNKENHCVVIHRQRGNHSQPEKYKL